MVVCTAVKTGLPILRRCRNGSIALPELSSNWFTSPAEVTGHQKLYSVTDSETALNTRPVVSRGSVSLQVRAHKEKKECGFNAVEARTSTDNVTSTVNTTTLPLGIPPPRNLFCHYHHVTF
ncbi:hypothetical protein DPMN_123751 [Dreissena polymorpha]|uniref:Uncharacterized protein n=1 Tax=Dreissena polymorpha TaxID=45954 RepID=A0A9D4GS74_DREPO|nr:hypothetical protein DPMN_123751 [Dreissena polymorpha]